MFRRINDKKAIPSMELKHQKQINDDKIKT